MRASPTPLIHFGSRDCVSESAFVASSPGAIALLHAVDAALGAVICGLPRAICPNGGAIRRLRVRPEGGPLCNGLVDVRVVLAGLLADRCSFKALSRDSVVCVCVCARRLSLGVSLVRAPCWRIGAPRKPRRLRCFCFGRTVLLRSGFSVRSTPVGRPLRVVRLPPWLLRRSCGRNVAKRNRRMTLSHRPPSALIGPRPRDIILQTRLVRLWMFGLSWSVVAPSFRMCRGFYLHLCVVWFCRRGAHSFLAMPLSRAGSR